MFYNGVNIFGPAPVFNHDEGPNAEQVNHFPGIVGIERLDLAPRESFSVVHGVMVGATPFDVGNAFVVLAAIKRRGAVGVLFDTEGVTWTDAILHQYRTIGRMTWAPGWGWCRDYEIIFLHLGTG